MSFLILKANSKLIENSMRFYELEKTDISNLNDGDLRELVARLCEAELAQQGVGPVCVLWGGAQEAADGGLDVHVKNTGYLKSPGFVPRANVGFQVKKNSMSKSACTKEMLDKAGLPKEVISELAENDGAYIIVSGKDDCSEKMLIERVSGMRAAVAGLVDKGNFLVDFYGRDRLLAWLRMYPSVALWVRSRLGKPLTGWKPFGRWAQTPIDKDDKFLSDNHPCVIDTSSSSKTPLTMVEGIALLRERLREVGSAIRITGLSGVGKTRLAQALFEPDVAENALSSTNVVYADLGDELSPTASEFISYLIANDLSANVILDNCPSDVHGKLRKQIFQYTSKICLLTIEYDISDDTPEETHVIHIEPSSEETVAYLVRRRFPEIQEINASKIAEFAGGNARVALALASRVKPDETLSKFTDESLFNRLFEQRKGKAGSLLDDAAVLSLFYSFNVSQTEYYDELERLSLISKIPRLRLYQSHAELLRRQLSQKRGDWRAVLPHALANRLARRALENIPLQDINSELFKSENIRLFKSCAHRIGYLHDFDLARKLAHTWIQPGAPLYDLTVCSDEQLQVVDYIAPVFPDAVLSAIELAVESQNFGSHGKEYFDKFIDLLCKLAYENRNFDRVINIVFRFAASNFPLDKDTIFNSIRGLFSLYLSGTQALPSRRQQVLGRLLMSNNTSNQDIAVLLFQSAFQAAHWSSSKVFNFGAHIRTYGWEPKTNQEALEWYEGFINVLQPCLRSGDLDRRSRARKILANHFRGLWSFAGCYDVLEELVVSQCKLNQWTEIWQPIKQTISFDSEKFSPSILSRLEALETLTYPSDLHAEIETYVFRPMWDHLHQTNEDYNEVERRVSEKIIDLGQQVASDLPYLESLGSRLYQNENAPLLLFGRGLAKGALSQGEMFDFLVKLLQSYDGELKRPHIFSGMIREIHNSNKVLARQLRERVLDIPKLSSHFVELLTSTDLEPWGVDLLIEMARKKDVTAWELQKLGHGRAHAKISDMKLAELIEAVINLECGAFVALDILSMRFLTENRSALPDVTLIVAGRSAISRFLETHANSVNRAIPSGIERVLQICINQTSPKKFISEVIECIGEGLKTSRFYSHDIPSVIKAIVISFPEMLLDYCYALENISRLSTRLFKNAGGRDQPSLNLVSSERLITWCNNDHKKIEYLIDTIQLYVSSDTSDDMLSVPKEASISLHALELLRVAANKAEVLEVFVRRMMPSCWSSLADILEVRTRAFATLLDHDLPEVREFVQARLPIIEASNQRERESEAVRNSEMEKRFES
ncbi:MULTISPECIES: hypothetical protein [Pseudomonas syringae group]|uniref:hypothetical protein n=1 Tax=Pseudomonas syringae group TaxID=136849 RepID=UPI0019323BF1|nr:MULTISPECIES: hypothetical protein [Pseudomonas syringae group]MBM0210880.1 hypothetical protein [Pseudomonas syringae pv. maculicola]